MQGTVKMEEECTDTGASESALILINDDDVDGALNV